MKAVHLQVDYLTQPLGLGNPQPRFFWHCDAERSGASPLEGTGGTRQTAYQIICTRDGETVWDSGRVESASMSHISYEGQELHSRDHIHWSVQLWNGNDESGETSESWFELGLLSRSDWTAKWICGDVQPKKNHRYPVDCFRRAFPANGKIVWARLYVTARGVYDVTINGHRIEDFILAPGVTDYRRRIQVQTYDVTALLREQNHIELRLADGWYRGSVAAYGVTNVFGTQISVLAQLEITYSDGSRQTITTDEHWQWSNDGPIRFADLKDGEVYDATKKPSYSGHARIAPPPRAEVIIRPSDNVPVRAHEELVPKLLTAPDGTRVLDFGQNIAGQIAFAVKGKKKERIKLTCGEVLDAAGHVDLKGVQETIPARGWSQMRLISKLLGKPVKGERTVAPKQEIQFLCSGGEDHYRTAFSVFGFRYAEIEADVDLSIRPEDFRAIAVYSDLEQTGDFTCSDKRINRLVENTRWSMKGNFLDVPTDCPTRERLGWTGDAQIFFNTGAYFMNTAPFFRKWLRDMADDQYQNGLISAVVPFSGVEMMYKATGSSVGWADALYLVPERFARMYGDESVIRDTWPMVKKYADYLLTHLGMRDKKAAKDNPYSAFTYEKGVHLGEWLEPEEFRDSVYGAQARHPEECTAYLYLAMTTMAEMAEKMGEHTFAQKLRETATGAQRAYIEQFVKTSAIDTDRQAKLVRPLALGVLGGDAYKAEKEKVQKQLLQAVENYRYRVGTGFLSTPFLLPMLAEAGYVEAAYRVLMNTERPGWLAEIAEGATTIWENWEGNLSQNHYSPGAVCEWLFSGVCGIRLTGERQFVIAPLPGGTLTEAAAVWRSVYGEVRSAWKRQKDGKITYTVTVPANTSALLRLPDGTERELAVGENVVKMER